MWYKAGAKTINVDGLSSVSFKDALEPASIGGAQSYAPVAYTYSYKASAAAAATTVASATDYMLYYNGRAATLGGYETPYRSNDAGNPIVACNGNELLKYGNNSGWGRFVMNAANGAPGANVSLTDIAKGTNLVNQRNEVGNYFFTSPWNQLSYAFNTAGNTKATTDNLNGTYTVDGSAYRARLVSGSSTEYYYVSILANGTLQFNKKVLGASDPVPATHTAMLKIYAADAFGRGFIYNDPFTADNFHVDDDLSRATPIMELPIQIVVE